MAVTKLGDSPREGGPTAQPRLEEGQPRLGPQPQQMLGKGGEGEIQSWGKHTSVVQPDPRVMVGGVGVKSARQSQPQPWVEELTGAPSETDLRVVVVQQADAARRAAVTLRLLKGQGEIAGKSQNTEIVEVGGDISERSRTD